MSIRTLQQYKYEHWDRTDRIDLGDMDRARDVPDDVWDNLDDPIPNWRTLSAYIKTFDEDKATRDFEYQPAGDLQLTDCELQENSMQHYSKLRRYLDACRASGFIAHHASGPAELGVINFPEDGNSLWYCLA